MVCRTICGDSKSKGGWNLSKRLSRRNVAYEEWIDMKRILFWWNVHRVLARDMKQPRNNYSMDY